MKNIASHLATLSITAWVGSLWAIGYLAVPVLFHAQPDRHLAGMLAGEMFSAAGYLDLICGMYLLWFYASLSGRAVIRQRGFWLVVSMLLISLEINFGIQPIMAALKVQALPLDVMKSSYADNFKLLHGVSSIAYLAESLLGAFLVSKHTSHSDLD
jgi:hypothetical protein